MGCVTRRGGGGGTLQCHADVSYGGGNGNRPSTTGCVDHHGGGFSQGVSQIQKTHRVVGRKHIGLSSNEYEHVCDVSDTLRRRSSAASPTHAGCGATPANGYLRRKCRGHVSALPRAKPRVRAGDMRMRTFKYHYARKQRRMKIIRLFHIASEEQPADLLTKNLDVLNCVGQVGLFLA